MRWPVFFLLPCCALAAGVTVLYNPAVPETGPFPSDILTIADTAQQTGRRVQIPLPNCGTQPSTCGELGLINQFDGFGLNPRLRVAFSGPVNVDTLKTGIRLIGSDGQPTAINQIVYDPLTNTAYAQPDQILRQATRYTLTVSDAVKDAQGDAVQPDPAFTQCVSTATDAYCTALRAAVGTSANIRSASLFTTMSATRFLEAARAQANSFPLWANVSTFGGTPSYIQEAHIFSLRTLNSVTWRQQLSADSQKFNDNSLPSPGLLTLFGFGRIAFGQFQSHSYLDTTQTIPTTPTAQPLATPQDISGTAVSFYALLPPGAPPAGGFPVVLAGHGIFDNLFGMPLSLAFTMVNRGFAVVALSPVGHGYGPASRMVVTDSTGQVTDFPFPGRAVDIDGNGQYDNGEGCVILKPGAPINIRDCLRQTAIDYTQMVRTLRQGIDLDGDGQPDLDGSRISFVGQSLGSFYGTLFTAEEPNVQTAVLNAGGGSAIGTARLSASFRQLVTLYLGTRQPALLNKFFDFDDNYPLRDQPVRVNNIPGALDIQEDLARLEWIETPGAPYAYAPLLKANGKSVMFQIALGDQTVPNPSNSQLVRAANGLQQTSLYRHDLARAEKPALPANPHAFLVNLDDPSYLIALTAQQQVAQFLLSGQPVVPDVNPLLAPYFRSRVFESPATLLETLNFQ